MTSEPFGVPVAVNPSTHIFWDVLAIDVGVAESTPPTPEATDKAKSPTSKSPEPPVALYTSSLKVTVKVLLAALRTEPVIVGAALSLKEAVLFDCVVEAAFEAPS